MRYDVMTKRDTEFITQNELLKAVKGVTQRQLKRWHGLILPLGQRRLGRKGTETIYSVDSIERLKAIKVLKNEKDDLNYIAWRLWWNGREVKKTYIRDLLKKEAAVWESGKRKLVDQIKGGLSEHAREHIKNSGRVYLESKPLRQARKKLSSKNFPDLIRILAEVATGQYKVDSETAEDDQWQVENGLRMHEGVAKNIAELQTWRERLPALPQASSLLAQYHFQKIASDSDDEELDQARDEVRLLLTFIESFVEVLERTIGRGAYGLSGIYKVIKHLSVNAQAILLLFWLGYRKSNQGQLNYRSFAARQQGLEARQLEQKALEDLRTEIPSLAKILSPEYRGKAFFNERTRKHYYNELDKIYQQHQSEIQEFWQRHPDYNGLIPETK